MRLASNTFIAIAALAVAGTWTQAQTPGAVSPASPAPNTAVIRGRVTTGDTGLPLPRAQLRLTVVGAPGAGILTGTDDQGRYEYTNLAPDRYIVTAEKGGFMKWAYGQRVGQGAGRQIDVAAGQVVEQIDLAMPRGGAAVVHVLDDIGGPFSGATVSLQQYSFVNAAPRLQSRFSADSDESGIARFSGLPPGDYYVMADPTPLQRVLIKASDGMRVLSGTYFPGVTSIAEAMKVSVAAGQEANVDLRLLNVSTFTVSGTARGVNGELITGPLVLTARGGAETGGLAVIQSDGSFTFSRVVPGNYTVRARITSRDPGQYSDVPVEVTGDVTGLEIRTTPGGTVRGRLQFADPRPPNVPLSSFSIWADPSWQGVLRPGMFTVHDDGTFELANVFGRSVLRPRNGAPLPVGWSVKSVTFDGRDITNTVVDFSTSDRTDVVVTYTSKQTELTGTAVNARNTPTSDFVAVIFPESREERIPQSRSMVAGRPDQQGRFKITGLPPGHYLAAALETLEIGEEGNPELLQRLEASATRVTLEEDEKKSINLRLP